MNAINKTCIGLLPIILSNTAAAIDLSGTPYVEGKFGYSWAKVHDVKKASTTIVSTLDHPTRHTNSFLVGASIGYEFSAPSTPVWIEAEYLQRTHLDYNTTTRSVTTVFDYSSDIFNQTILGNLFFDIFTKDRFHVFVGGGMGLALNETKSKTIETSPPSSSVVKQNVHRYSFSWMGSAGAAFDATNWLTISASYRYSGLGALRWRSSIVEYDTNEFDASEAILGFRLTMPE